MVIPIASLFPCKYTYESQECTELLVFRFFFPHSFEYIDIMISCTRGINIRKCLARGGRCETRDVLYILVIRTYTHMENNEAIGMTITFFLLIFSQ